MEPVKKRHQPLVDAIRSRHKIVLERLELQKEESVLTTEILDLMRRFQDELEVDRDKDGNKVYRYTVADIVCEMTIKEKPHITTSSVSVEM